MAVLPTPAAERALVDRCLCGDLAAREELFRRYRQPLARALDHHYHANKRREEIAEELLERVILRVVKDRYRPLAKFNPQRGRLVKLLERIALDERSAQQRLCSVWQQNREVALEGEAWLDPTANDFTALEIEDFRLILTAMEDAYLTERLAKREPPSIVGAMTAQERYLRWRVSEKARTFFQNAN
jgi:hypothetical protein